MTGKLNIDTGIEHGLDLRSDAGVRTMSLSASSATHSGIIEFWDPNGTTRRGYIGYGDVNSLNLTGEGTATWSVKNGLFMNGGLGIRWASDSDVTGQHDLSKGICLYGSGTTSQFGFNITSGTLNYIVQNGGNKHNFIVGTANKLQINSAGLTQPTVADNANGYFVGDRYHGMYFHGGNKLVFTEYHDHFNWRRQTTGTTGFGGDQRMTLIGGNLDASGTVSTRAVIDRSLLEEYPDLEPFAAGEDPADSEIPQRGVNLGRLLLHALAEIKSLKAEIAALKGRK
jgi:hypothetical protein